MSFCIISRVLLRVFFIVHAAFVRIKLMMMMMMMMTIVTTVCLSVHEHISTTTSHIFTDFLYMLLVAVARSSSGGIVIRYVLPVSWMTLRLHIIARNK